MTLSGETVGFSSESDADASLGQCFFRNSTSAILCYPSSNFRGHKSQGLILENQIQKNALSLFPPYLILLARESCTQGAKENIFILRL